MQTRSLSLDITHILDWSFRPITVRNCFLIPMTMLVQADTYRSLGKYILKYITSLHFGLSKFTLVPTLTASTTFKTCFT